MMSVMFPLVLVGWLVVFLATPKRYESQIELTKPPTSLLTRQPSVPGLLDRAFPWEMTSYILL